jgi:hypothetical protein
MAELLAAVWIPLLVLYALRKARSWCPLAFTVAAVWLTNAPAAVMGCYLLAGMIAVAAVQDRSWKLALRLAGAVALGLGIAGFWLVPAIVEQQWVQIQLAIGPLMRVEDSFLFGYVKLSGPGVSADDLFNANYHNQILRMASGIVLALMFATLLAAWFARRKKGALWGPLVASAAAICALQFHWSDLAWHALPKLEFLQFPWRWMLVLAMILSALAALALREAVPTRRTIAMRALAMLLLASSMSALASTMFWQACDEEDNVQAQIATFRSQGFEGTDEYTLQGVDLGAQAGIASQNGSPGPITVMNTPDAGEPGRSAADAGEKQIPARIVIERWQTEHRTVLITSPEAGFAVLQLMDYPAWRVTRNGVDAAGVTRRRDGLMAVPIDAGTNRIDVRWKITSDQWAGILLSIVALAITFAFPGGLFQRKTQDPRIGTAL